MGDSPHSPSLAISALRAIAGGDHEEMNNIFRKRHVWVVRRAQKCGAKSDIIERDLVGIARGFFLHGRRIAWLRCFFFTGAVALMCFMGLLSSLSKSVEDVETSSVELTTAYLRARFD